MPHSRLQSVTMNQLFSSDYLLNRLPLNDNWRHSFEDRELLHKIEQVFQNAGTLLQQGNEEQIRDEIVNKILAIVNPHYLSNETLPTGLPPDYIFFPDHNSKLNKDLRMAIAVGDAKPPGTDFDITDFTVG